MAGILDRRSARLYQGTASGIDSTNKSAAKLEAAARMVRDDINRSERMQEKVDKDDFLLAQIDEFREKAQRLQEMLNTKETKAQELSSIVEEREAKAQELQQILDERQEKADGITAQVAKQIDVLIASVHEKMHEIETSMNASMDNLGRSISGDVDSLGRAMSGQIGNLGQSIGGEISGIGQNLDFGDTLEQTRRITEESTAAMTAAVNDANANMLNSLAELNEQLVALKSDLSDKVHTENVKCFRNIQDLFKVMGNKVDTVSEFENQVKSAKSFSMVSCVLAIINTFGFVAIALYIFGAFGAMF